MADSSNNQVLPWLERELARQLAPVMAPESLWDQIHSQPRQPRRVASLDWIFWPAAAAMVLLAFAGVLRTIGGPQDPDKFTQQDFAVLAGTSRGLDFRSDSFEETRAWVKSEADIDIDLPAGRQAADPGAVHLLGARLVRLRGLPIAAIDYRVGDQLATLFVSGRQAGLSGDTEVSKHLFTRVKSGGETQLFSWNMRNQTYAIALSGTANPHSACLLCHASTPGLIVFGLPGIN